VVRMARFDLLAGGGSNPKIIYLAGFGQTVEVPYARAGSLWKNLSSAFAVTKVTPEPDPLPEAERRSALHRPPPKPKSRTPGPVFGQSQISDSRFQITNPESRIPNP